MKNKIDTFEFTHYLLLILFFFHQVYYISKGGTTWDDLEILNTSSRIIDKAYWFFTDRSNPFLGDFNFNLEYYGYVIPLVIYFLTLNILKIENLSAFLYKFLNVEIFSELDLVFWIRNVLISLYCCILLAIIYKVLRKTYEKSFSLNFLIFLLMTPSFSGHSLFNIKDIPFSLQYFLATLVIINFEIDKVKISKNNLKTFIFYGFIFGLVVLVRFNGYAFLLMISLFMFIYNFESSIHNIKNIVKNWSFIYLLSFLFLILFSPSAWNDPIFWLKGVYETQFNIDWLGSTLTNGDYILGIEMQPRYLFLWFFYRLPLNLILGLLIFLIFPKFYKIYSFSKISIFSSYIIFVVFATFTIIRPIAYDGIRQFLFLIPFFVVLFVEFINFLKFKFGKNFGTAVILISIFYLLLSQQSLGEYKYVYFNELISENEITIDCEDIGGCGNWETDYWGFSIKSLMKKSSSIENIAYCEPKHIFNTYRQSTEFNKNDFPVYIASIHRKLDRTLCSEFIYEYKKCEIFKKETANLRGTNINLSYIYKCNN